jgi:hypothetical protein
MLTASFVAKKLLERRIDEKHIGVFVRVLHDEHSVCQHRQHMLPLSLLYLALCQQLERVAQIKLIHPNQTSREENHCRHVNIKVITDALKGLHLNSEHPQWEGLDRAV